MAGYADNSMAAVFFNQVDQYGEKPCVAFKQNGRYTDVSWIQMGERVKALAYFLIVMGIQKGDRVALFSPNRHEWWISDLAVLSVGAIDVPVYPSNSAEETFYILDHSGAKACFVGGREHLETVLEVKGRLRNLEFLVAFDPVITNRDCVFSWSHALVTGAARDTRDEFDTRCSSIHRSDLATISYTSGTTGPPKGVMLSHNNFISNIRQILTDFKDILSDKDLFLSFLPLSHALERTAGFYLPISIGAKVAFAENVSTLQENMKEIKPTVVISVPRMYEKFREGIFARFEKESVLKKILFRWAIKVVSRNVTHTCTQENRPWLFAAEYDLADRLILSKIKAAIGMDRMRLSISGGGPLSVQDCEFFLGMGVTVIEGYGLTETTPVTHVNRPWLIKPGTVGPPVEDTLTKFSDQAEVLIKGPQVMLGYYKDEQATRLAFTRDGFFRTGDIGSVDRDGYLSITGRLKDIIITSGGKNVSPHRILTRLRDSPFIGQACIFGDRKKFVSALIVPAFTELEPWAQKQGIEYRDHADLIRRDQVIRLYEQAVETCARHLSKSEKIRKFKLMSSEWTQQTGEMTPTLKVKRQVLETKYKELIESMYLD